MNKHEAAGYSSPRAPTRTLQGVRGQPHRHRPRVVRLRDLLGVRGTGLPTSLLPQRGSAHRNPSCVLDVRRRLCRTTRRRVRVRPSGRHHRTQETPGHHAVVDRFHDLCDRLDPEPCVDRNRRADPPRHYAVRAGRRGRRRVGRRGPAVQRVRQPTPARVLGVRGADRSAGRQPARQRRAGDADRVDDRGPVRKLGLADRIPGIRGSGRLRVVDPTRTRGHPDLQGPAEVG